jgi:hypothetical protein
LLQPIYHGPGLRSFPFDFYENRVGPFDRSWLPVVSLTWAAQEEQQPPPKRRGKFDEADRALHPALEELMANGRSRRAATLELAYQGKIAGGATTESKAKRLERSHRSQKSHFA